MGIKCSPSLMVGFVVDEMECQADIRIIISTRSTVGCKDQVEHLTYISNNNFGYIFSYSTIFLSIIQPPGLDLLLIYKSFQPILAFKFPTFAIFQKMCNRIINSIF